MSIFSIAALNTGIRNRKQAEINSKQKKEERSDHENILIAHFHPNRSFSELTCIPDQILHEKDLSARVMISVSRTSQLYS